MVRPWVRHFVAIGLLIFGVEAWLTFLHGIYGRYYEPKAIVVAFVVAAIWPVSKRFDIMVTWCDRFLARHRGRTAVVIGISAFLYLYFLPVDPNDGLYLKFHDEHSYMIQTHMLAHGKLWMPAYPPEIQPFFDNFHLIVDRVYASIYFPGTALAMVPGIWLHLPYWGMPIIIASIAAAFFYLVVQDIFGAVRGLIAILMLLSLFYFYHQSQMVLSEIPFLLGEVVLIWTWLRWRDRQNWRWMIPMGVAAGFAAITRPMDALVIAIPVGIAILVELRPGTLRHLLPAAAAAIVGVAPFLGLQIFQNVGVTGSWHVFPSDYYVARNYPAPMLGFYHFDPAKVPVSTCEPKEDAMRQWIIPAYQNHTISAVPGEWIPLPKNGWFPGRSYDLLLSSLPNEMMLVMVPLAFLSLTDIRRKVIASSMVLFVLGYAAFVFFLAHYMVAIMPAMICLILMGWETLERLWPRIRPAIVTMMVLTLASLSIGAFPQNDPYHAPMLGFPEQKYANEQLDLLPQSPALVLFHYDPDKCSFHDEPAYNDSVAFPDDAMIVRARDLGPREDKILFQYYAQRQPDRMVYYYDRGAIGENRRPLKRLGNVRDLANQP
jgi:hypothetical protein